MGRNLKIRKIYKSFNENKTQIKGENIMFEYLWVPIFAIVILVIIKTIINYFKKENETEIKRECYSDYLTVNGFIDSATNRREFEELYLKVLKE